MSVASEITRLQTAKSNLKTSINAKNDAQHQIGDETLDEFADFVDAIQTGGGGDLSDHFKLLSAATGSYINLGSNNMGRWFNALKDVAFPGLSGTNCANLFFKCPATNIDLSKIDTSEVTDMSSMFNACSNLANVNLSSFDTSNVTTMNAMFYNCNQLDNLDLSNFDFSKIKNINYFIYSTGSPVLKNLIFGTNLGRGYTQTTSNYADYTLNLSTMTSLTHDSLMSVINNLYDLNLTYNVAGGGTLYKQTLNLGATNLAKLTSAEIAIAQNKGWTVQ